jgi:hypothetical protein
MAAQSEITGKKKIIVDKSVFIDLLKDEEGQITAASNEYYCNVHLPYNKKDTIRVALGKYWDYELPLEQIAQPGGTKLFNNNHPKINVFCSTPIELVECEDPRWLETTAQGLPVPLGGTDQKIVLSCTVSAGMDGDLNRSFSFVEGSPGQPIKYSDVYFWIYLMKYGLIDEEGNYRPPIAKTGEIFYDHYHETHAPFTPEELASQSLPVKSFYVDYKTFYNNRSSSVGYENFISHSYYQNLLPNVYSFVKMIIEKDSTVSAANYLSGLTATFDQINTYFDSPTSDLSRIPKNLYTDMLKYFPLETTATLYAAKMLLGKEPSFEQLLKADIKKVDINSLYSMYISNFIMTIRTLDREFELLEAYTGYGGSGIDPTTKLGALEYINSNLIFSPHLLTIFKKVNQYKNNFPMYFEMNFTAQLFTLIGDSMKDFHITKFLASEIAASQGIFGQRSGSDFDAFKQNNSTNYDFVEFAQKDVYENLEDSNFLVLPLDGTTGYSEGPKKMINLINSTGTGVLDKWIDDLDYSSQNQHLPVSPVKASTWADGIANDLRNYVSYIKDNSSESADPNCELFYKKLFGPALRQKLINIYAEKKRSYMDIINGVPAYTEDLFYVIKKYRKDASASQGVLGETNVQNIIIPNTSDLNIVEYVDTQVKYGLNATYRYEVYAHRVVFGCEYRYHFGTRESGKESYSESDAVPSLGNVQVLAFPFSPEIQMATPGGDAITPESMARDITTSTLDEDGYFIESDYETRTYTALLTVDIFPSIQLVEDKIFSTPDVIILDRPPVPPHVDIVPYRAVGNKIKIILAGAFDTYRDTPVIILEEQDSLMFQLLAQSQFSYDNKIEFSSDDRISGFQVFRTEARPNKYSDFSLHPDVPEISGGTAAFDDLIQPNKKYYYTFRAIDNHNHVSNPTAVYEVELIDEKGAVKPIIRTISMDAIKNKTPVKDFQKYVLLRPTDKQIYFFDQEGVNSIFSTDLTDDETKRKKYKMRLTSKGSGKKIDINFSFAKKFTTD